MDGTVLILVAALLIALFVYFLPTVIARSRRHRDRTAIFVLNLLAGWTFFGWVAALVWSLTSNVEHPEPATAEQDELDDGHDLPGASTFTRNTDAGLATRGDSAPDPDPLLISAMEICIQRQQGSTSVLQRHFDIGYARAARIIDQLERAGVVSRPNRSGERSVLIQPVQLDKVSPEG